MRRCLAATCSPLTHIKVSDPLTPLCRGSKVKYELDKDTGMREC
jgi:hypothetical protein